MEYTDNRQGVINALNEYRPGMDWTDFTFTPDPQVKDCWLVTGQEKVFGEVTNVAMVVYVGKHVNAGDVGYDVEEVDYELVTK